MKFTWLGLYNRGDLALERVHFRVHVDVDLSFFVVLDTQRLDTNRVFSGNRGCFWFASQPVKAGDNIVLYTRAGIPNVENRPDGAVFHFFFRGLSAPLYQNQNTSPVILDLNGWATVL